MVGAIDREHLPAPEKTMWEDAAKQWRLPYWDWAAKQAYINDYGLPEIFTKETVDVLDFDPTVTTRATVPNPLWKFSNPGGIAMGATAMGKYALIDFPVWTLRDILS